MFGDMLVNLELLAQRDFQGLTKNKQDISPQKYGFQRKKLPEQT